MLTLGRHGSNPGSSNEGSTGHEGQDPEQNPDVVGKSEYAKPGRHLESMLGRSAPYIILSSLVLGNQTC